jgi:threonine/homoserine/homoserine lactone efflux protein
MSWSVWALFVVTETALCLSPGPAVLLVLSQALVRGTGPSVWSNLGILTGNTMYFALTATGLGAVLVASYEAFFLIKWVGAAYLVWLGVTAWRGRSSVLSVAPDGAPAVGSRRMFLNGFVLQAANPKALIFFTALLPQFIDPRMPVIGQVAILGATSVVVEFIVLLAYGALAGRMAFLATRPRFRSVADRVAGSMLITAGVSMAAIRRS